MKYECLKVFGNIKTLAVILLMFLISTILSMQNNTIMYEGFNTDVYRYYMDILEGEYTQEKHDYVKNEYEDMLMHIEKSDYYDEQFKNSEISATEYRKLSSAADLAKSRIDTFEYILMKTEYYATCDEVPSYFCDIDIEDYIVNMGINIPLILSLILIVSTLYNEDYSANMVSMIRSSKDGKERLFFRRVGFVIIVSIVFSMLFYMGEFVAKYLCMDLGGMNSNIVSIMGMKNSSFGGTIFEYLMMSVAIRTAYTAIFALFISVVAMITHKYIMTFAISLGALYLPIAITESVFALGRGLYVYPLFVSENSVAGFSTAFVMIVVYGALMSGLVVAEIKRECV